MNGKAHNHFTRGLWEVASLRSSRGRITFFSLASFCIYLLPISILAGFSLWHRLGVPSPSIGLTRAYHYILHGELSHAWHQNWLIYVILLLGLPIITKDAYNTLMLMYKRKQSNG